MRVFCRIMLIVLTVACGLAAAVTAPLALMTAVMAFDAPGSEQKPWVWVASFAILSIPLWFVGGAALGWLLYRRGLFLGSLAAAAVPIVAFAIGWSWVIG